MDSLCGTEKVSDPVCFVFKFLIRLYLVPMEAIGNPRRTFESAVTTLWATKSRIHHSARLTIPPSDQQSNIGQNKLSSLSSNNRTERTLKRNKRKVERQVEAEEAVADRIAVAIFELLNNTWRLFIADHLPLKGD